MLPALVLGDTSTLPGADGRRVQGRRGLTPPHRGLWRQRHDRVRRGVADRRPLIGPRRRRCHGRVGARGVRRGGRSPRPSVLPSGSDGRDHPAGDRDAPSPTGHPGAVGQLCSTADVRRAPTGGRHRLRAVGVGHRCAGRDRTGVVARGWSTEAGPNRLADRGQRRRRRSAGDGTARRRDLEDRPVVVSVAANLAVAARHRAHHAVIGTAAAAVSVVWPAAAELMVRFTGPELWWLLRGGAAGVGGARRRQSPSRPAPSVRSASRRRTRHGACAWRWRWGRVGVASAAVCAIAWALAGSGPGTCRRRRDMHDLRRETNCTSYSVTKNCSSNGRGR